MYIYIDRERDRETHREREREREREISELHKCYKEGEDKLRLVYWYKIIL